MNLNQFVNYRPSCPLCSQPLILTFLSNKRKLITNDQQQLLAFFNLTISSTPKHPYRMSINFEQFSNYFTIDFYKKYLPTSNPLNTKSPPLTVFPVELIHATMKFMSLVKPYKFFNSCSMCLDYHAASNPISLDFDNNTFPPLNTELECFSFHQQLDDQYMFIKLVNNLLTKTSNIFYYKYQDEDFPKWELSTNYRVPKIKTNLIQISDNILDKLNKIILLS